MTSLPEYQEKDATYFAHLRTDVLQLLPCNLERVLEVGCGEGRGLRWLKENRGVKWTAGIELVPPIAERAKRNADQVFCGDVMSMSLPFPPDCLDAIVCLDVLEHTIDPWSLVRSLTALLKPGGVMLASLPNVRYLRTSLGLLFGKWSYTDSGILDRTHLRFFVKSSAVELFEQAQLKVDVVKGTGMGPGSRSRTVNRVTFGLFQQFFEFQYVIRAVKPA